jgi:hypothetical protein
LIQHQPLDVGLLQRVGVPASLSDLIQELADKDACKRPQNFAAVIRRIDLIAV